MGQHVGNMFVNREASPIEAAETVHTTLLDQTLAPGATSDVGAVSENHGQMT